VWKQLWREHVEALCRGTEMAPKSHRKGRLRCQSYLKGLGPGSVDMPPWQQILGCRLCDDSQVPHPYGSQPLSRAISHGRSYSLRGPPPLARRTYALAVEEQHLGAFGSLILSLATPVYTEQCVCSRIHHGLAAGAEGPPSHLGSVRTKILLCAVFLSRPKCDPNALTQYCHNVLGGGHISQSLALFWPWRKHWLRDYYRWMLVS
jgi:hypothetical protein